ncbi:hypothetical protein BGZ51_000271 [Haplosporangium sp. Z 767]|nr:hypothetical protein BGZ50_003410 [Haplosporangium sp. Z 11]KAF9188861.1 hypothetical protein BGZ51_000271 [Haplosporangium sp. Z 767]
MPKVTKKETKVSKRAKNDEPKKRKKKAKKDPNAPKNPMSAYLLFCEEWREKVKAQNPDASFGKSAVDYKKNCAKGYIPWVPQQDRRDLIPFSTKIQKMTRFCCEIGRLLGEKWRSYSADQKAPYITKHEKAKAKYATDKAAYDTNKADEDDEEEEEESD